MQQLFNKIQHTMMSYDITLHGDWLEKEAADFIRCNIPAYEDIWQHFIGHRGDGFIAMMNNISQEDEEKRRNFAQHHYTILESLYFMQCIVDEVSETPVVNDFPTYRKILNQIMAYQAYAGRLRDNMEKCFIIMANKDEADKALQRLEEFYHQRVVFVHGRKVPFAIDQDKLFKIATIKKNTASPLGFGLEMPWEAIDKDDMQYLEDALTSSINELKPIVNDLLSKLYNYVQEFIRAGGLFLYPPVWDKYIDDIPSGHGPLSDPPTMQSSGSSIGDYFQTYQPMDHLYKG